MTTIKDKSKNFNQRQKVVSLLVSNNIIRSSKINNNTRIYFLFLIDLRYI